MGLGSFLYDEAQLGTSGTLGVGEMVVALLFLCAPTVHSSSHTRAQYGDQKGESHLDPALLLLLTCARAASIQFFGEQCKLGFVGYFSRVLPPIPSPLFAHLSLFLLFLTIWCFLRVSRFL